MMYNIVLGLAACLLIVSGERTPQEEYYDTHMATIGTVGPVAMTSQESPCPNTLGDNRHVWTNVPYSGSLSVSPRGTRCLAYPNVTRSFEYASVYCGQIAEGTGYVGHLVRGDSWEVNTAIRAQFSEAGAEVPVWVGLSRLAKDSPSSITPPAQSEQTWFWNDDGSLLKNYGKWIWYGFNAQNLEGSQPDEGGSFCAQMGDTTEGASMVHLYDAASCDTLQRFVCELSADDRPGFPYNRFDAVDPQPEFSGASMTLPSGALLSVGAFVVGVAVLFA